MVGGQWPFAHFPATNYQLPFLLVINHRAYLRTEFFLHALYHRIVSGASVVIPGAEAPLGVLSVHTRSPRGFSGEDVFFLQSVANVLSAAKGRNLAHQAVVRGYTVRFTINPLAW